MVVAIPPEPVGPLGDEHLFTRARQRLRRNTGDGFERPPRVRELAPGTLVVRVSNPDIEVRVDPRTWKDRRHRVLWHRARLRHRDRLQRRMGAKLLVERPEERTTLPFVMLPGILAVEDDEDGRLSPVGPRGVA